MKDIVIGVLMTLFGIAVIWVVSKRPKNNGISSIVNFKGYTFGVGFIFLGLMFVFGGLHF